jgi:hypothetical protein
METSAKAFMLSTKAKFGDVKSQLELGLMYYKGKEIERNIEKSIHWLEKACKNENTTAMYYLGCINQFIKKNYVEAAKLYEKAANRGQVDAQRALGDLYLSGKGVQGEPKKSLYWFTLAAESNNAEAQFYVGEFNCFGHGIEVNIEKAIYWYKLAAANNYEEAKKRLKFISINGVEYIKPSDKLENKSFFFKQIFDNIKGESYSIKDIPLDESLINICQGLSFNMSTQLAFAESCHKPTRNLFIQGAAYMFSKAVEAAMLKNYPEDFTFDIKKISAPEYSTKISEYMYIIKETEEIGKVILMIIVKEAEGLGIKADTEGELWTNHTNLNINLKCEEEVLVKWVPLLGLAYSNRNGYLGLINDKKTETLNDKDTQINQEKDLSQEAWDILIQSAKKLKIIGEEYNEIDAVRSAMTPVKHKLLQNLYEFYEAKNKQVAFPHIRSCFRYFFVKSINAVFLWQESETDDISINYNFQDILNEKIGVTEHFEIYNTSPDMCAILGEEMFYDFQNMAVSYREYFEDGLVDLYQLLSVSLDVVIRMGIHAGYQMVLKYYGEI